MALRVLVLASFDSFLRAGAACARRLEAEGATVEYALVFARLGQISARQQAALGFDPPLSPRSIESVSAKSFLQRFDVVIVALDGLRTRRFMIRFRRLWRRGDAARPVTVSLYPGVVFRMHLEGMMSRMSCDLVLLNSPADRRLYAEMCEALGVPDNSLCAGLSFLGDPGAAAASAPRDGDVVFVGQANVPPGRQERAYVVDQLLRLARRFPNQRFVLKPRHRPGESTLHRAEHHYEDLLAEQADGAARPRNLVVSYEPMDRVLGATRLCLTFSSTAAIEAIAHGVPTRILTDLGIHENLGNHFYVGSGALCDLCDVVPDMPFAVDRDWLADKVATGDGIESVAARIGMLVARQGEAGIALPPPGPRLFGRVAAYDRFIESTLGWPALDLLGASGAALGRLGRIRRLWTPVQRALLGRARR